MEKNNGRKWTIIAFAFVCVAITGLTVAFASLSTQLNVSPQARVLGNEWKIVFDDVQLLQPVGDAVAQNAITDPAFTTITIPEIQLKLPGDSVTYTFDVVNKGTIDAKIFNITMPTLPLTNCTGEAEDLPTADADAALVCGNISYTLKYSTGDTAAGTTPAVGNTLAQRTGESVFTKRNMTLTITYGGNEIPSDDVVIEDLEFIIVYVQD